MSRVFEVKEWKTIVLAVIISLIVKLYHTSFYLNH